MKSRPRPTPEQIAGAPELAILCALEELLEIATRALIAAHPVIGDTDAPYWVRHTTRLSTAARALIDSAEPLHRAVRDYTHAAANERAERSDDPNDFPF